MCNQLTQLSFNLSLSHCLLYQVKYMSDKSMEMPVRVASLEYLGLVAARLRRDSVHSRAKLATMDAVVRDIRAEEEKDGNQTQV